MAFKKVAEISIDKLEDRKNCNSDLARKRIYSWARKAKEDTYREAAGLLSESLQGS